MGEIAYDSRVYKSGAFSVSVCYGCLIVEGIDGHIGEGKIISDFNLKDCIKFRILGIIDIRDDDDVLKAVICSGDTYKIIDENFSDGGIDKKCGIGKSVE